LRLLILTNEPEIGLVHEVGGLQSLPGDLVYQPLRSQFAQFLVDQGQELFSGLEVAPLDRREDVRDVANQSESPEISNPAASTRPRAPSLGLPTNPRRADGVAPQTNIHDSVGIE